MSLKIIRSCNNELHTESNCCSDVFIYKKILYIHIKINIQLIVFSKLFQLHPQKFIQTIHWPFWPFNSVLKLKLLTFMTSLQGLVTSVICTENIRPAAKEDLYSEKQFRGAWHLSFMAFAASRVVACCSSILTVSLVVRISVHTSLRAVASHLWSGCSLTGSWRKRLSWSGSDSSVETAGADLSPSLSSSSSGTASFHDPTCEP